MQKQDLLKGLIAGLAGGIIATAAKTIWEANFPVRDKKTDSPPVKLAEEIVNHELTEKQKQSAEQSIHLAFGIGTGVFYGALSEEIPMATTALGVPFGLAFYALTHGSVVPALELEPFPYQVHPQQYAINEFAGHLVYGVALEVTRRGVRVLLA